MTNPAPPPARQAHPTTLPGPRLSRGNVTANPRDRRRMPPTPTKRRPESNLVAHARRELRIIGEDQDVIEGLTNVVQAFAAMGHSGGSAHFAALYLDKLLRFQPLSELTDDPGEWIDRHAEGLTTSPLWQSTRNPEAFSTDGGTTYYLLSEQEAAGDISTTPLHRSKVVPQCEPAEETTA